MPWESDNMEKGYTKRRILFFVIILLVAVSIIGILYTRKGKKAETIRTTGVVEGIEVNLSSKVSGRISELCCKEGDRVKEGQIVFELDSEDLRASVEQARARVGMAKEQVMSSRSAIENANANIVSSEADIKTAQSNVEKARAQMEFQKTHRDRYNDLYAKNVIPKESLDQAVTAYNASAADYTSSESGLNSASARRDAALAQLNTSKYQLNASEASLKEAEANLSYNLAKLGDTTVRSPISGAVVFKALEKGETVSPGITVLTIVDLNELYVRVDLEETLIDRITLNGPAHIRTEGTLGTVFKGRVTEIGRYGEFATQRDVLRGRQDIKTFRVKIAIEDSGGLLKPGMTVEVEIPKRM
jgi:HlyD family secretion protein